MNDMETIDAMMREHRKQSFAVEVQATKRPMMENEATVSYTFNGHQWYTTSLTPSEAKTIIEALRAHWGDRLGASS